MKVSTFNKYQCFVNELMHGIIWEMAQPALKKIFTSAQSQKIEDLAAELEVLRQLCNKLERFKFDPLGEDIEEDCFLGFITDDIIETVVRFASNNKHGEIKTLMHTYSRIFLSDIFNESCNASAMISVLFMCKNKTLDCKWMITDSRKEKAIKIFTSEIDAIIQKLSRLVV